MEVGDYRVNDYSGAFNPNLKWDDFAKEKLADCLNLYGNLFLAVDGFWYLCIKDHYDDKTAMSCDLWVWEKFIRYELKRLTKLFNIGGDDVEALFKAFQVSAWGGNIQSQMILQDRNRGLLTVESCPTLEAIKKEGRGREKYFCREVEQPMFEMYARYFSPRIAVRAFSIPPRSEGSGVCCQWEFLKL